MTEPGRAPTTNRISKPTNTAKPNMHTSRGPVGTSERNDATTPVTSVAAPTAHAIHRATLNRLVNRNATTPGMTSELNTMRTPATGTENEMTIPKSA